jgi:hypothetical protein
MKIYFEKDNEFWHPTFIEFRYNKTPYHCSYSGNELTAKSSGFEDILSDKFKSIKIVKNKKYTNLSENCLTKFKFEDMSDESFFLLLYSNFLEIDFM